MDFKDFLNLPYLYKKNPIKTLIGGFIFIIFLGIVLYFKGFLPELGKMSAQKFATEEKGIKQSLSKTESKGQKSSYDETQKGIYSDQMRETKDTISISNIASSQVASKSYEKINGAFILRDFNNKLIWAFPRMVACNWDHANEYAEEEDIGGYGGWQLPSISQANTLMKNYDNIADEVECCHYWLDESIGYYSKLFHLKNGQIEKVNKSSLHFVVLIRSMGNLEKEVQDDQ